MARLTRQEDEEQKRRIQEEQAAATATSGLLRSERMCMVQLIVQHDAAQHTVEELGRLGSLMFVDLNEGVSAFRRNFMPELRRCDEADRLLRYISDSVAAAGLATPRADWRDDLRDSMTELLPELDEAVRDIRQLTSSHRELCASYSALVELSHVLQKCDDIFSEARAHGEQVGGVGVPSSLSYAELVRAPSLGMALDEQSSHGSFGGGGYGSPYPSTGGGEASPWAAPPAHPEDSSQLDGPSDVEAGGSILGALFGGSAAPVGLAGANRLGYICGVVPRARLPAFERLLFRATRGNMFMRTVDIGEMVRGGGGEGRERGGDKGRDGAGGNGGVER
jgi:V-type H+-transporting ATPase subunit a